MRKKLMSILIVLVLIAVFIIFLLTFLNNKKEHTCLEDASSSGEMYIRDIDDRGDDSNEQVKNESETQIKIDDTQNSDKKIANEILVSER